jgi:hypothetical protein
VEKDRRGGRQSLNGVPGVLGTVTGSLVGHRVDGSVFSRQSGKGQHSNGNSRNQRSEKSHV